jgi:Mg2+-importing ATPase
MMTGPRYGRHHPAWPQVFLGKSYRSNEKDMAKCTLAGNYNCTFEVVIGPVSSIFDFFTFYIMLTVFHAGEALFHTGWFIESMATQVLVIFIIRTRKNPFKSRPNPWLIACSLTVVAMAVLLPFTSAGAPLGFVAPPTSFFLILIAMLVAYLLAVEWMKQWFFRHYAAE